MRKSGSGGDGCKTGVNGCALVLFAVGSVALGEINLKAGDPESQVLAALGEPQGKAEMGATTLYMYDGGNVIVKNGKVASIPKGLEETAQQRQAEKIKQAQFEADQKAKGLVLYKSVWITPERKLQLEEKALSEEKAREKEYFATVRAQQEKEAKAAQLAKQADEDKRRYEEEKKLGKLRPTYRSTTKLDIKLDNDN
jgi:hypothetical protein